jgi:carboxylesterase
LALIIWVALHPIPISGFDSHPGPVIGYDEAILQIKAMQEDDNRDIARDVCITKLFDHGAQTEHVIVFLHGFTNCPEQFGELGKGFFEAGFNVFIPRQPYHGLSDRMTDDLEKLTAEDLCAFGEKVLNTARGLGKRVTVMGISGGGNIAAWLAQNRADLDFTFAIAPMFGLVFLPPLLTKFLGRLVLLLPNFFLWWDPKTREDNPYSIYYAYPRYPSRALAEIMRLAQVTRKQAENSPPAGQNITMIINDAEPAVSNVEILGLLKVWRKHGKGILNEVHLEKDLQLPHDIITPGVHGVVIKDLQSRLIGAVKRIHDSQ